ncbi:hypothetical protein [Acinetobacter guillouiae]|uniref:hypothetical protein n=1 Tax=Acinetobacter guillouiae TaxID=106649 RepID=UPI003AF821FF
MREITLNEMVLVSGAADDSGSSTSRDFKTALIALGVQEGYKAAQSQIDYYTSVYEQAGWSGVALAATPGSNVSMFSAAMFGQLRSMMDGNGYSEKTGGNY